MTERIKKMLAERAAQAPKRTKWDDRVDETFALIDRAAPFMDEGSEPGTWRPSDKLKLVYSTVATAPNVHPDKVFEAIKFIHDMIVKARELWVNGYHPDPWREIPVPILQGERERE